MTPWLVASGAGLAFALLQYVWRRTHRGALAILAGALRFLVVTLVVALLLDAVLGAPKPVSSWAALDVSESMQRGDSALWRAARDSLRSAAADTTLFFGDSARIGAAPTRAKDVTSELRPVADRALASGHPVVVVTDGELADPDAAANLPAGSRLVVLARPSQSDAAVSALEVPRAVVAGDTITARITIASGAGGSGPGIAAVLVDGREVTRMPSDALPAFGARTMESRIRIDGAAGPALLQAVAAA